MEQHPNARLTPRGRGDPGLARGSPALRCRRGRPPVGRQPPDREQVAAPEQVRRGPGRPRQPPAEARPGSRPARSRTACARARSSMLLAPLALAAATGVPARTCARIVARRGLPRLADVDRVTGEVRPRGRVTPVRYVRGSARASWCTSTSRRSPASPTAAATARWGADAGRRAARGRSCLHVAVDDRSRVAYAELLPDERKGNCAAFMGRCSALLRRAGRGHRARHDRQRAGLPRAASSTRSSRRRASAHVYTRPFSAWQNGKVERMNRTIAQEWQYARAWDGEAERASALPAFIERCNWDRPHSACGGLPPMSRIIRCKQPIGTQQLAVCPIDSY